MEKEEEKKKGTKQIIIAIFSIVFIVLTCFMTVFFLVKSLETKKINSNLSKQDGEQEEIKNKNEKSNVTDMEDNENETAEIIDVDDNENQDISSNCLNCSEDIYIIAHKHSEDIEEAEQFILKSSDNNVILTINWNSFCEWSRLKECPDGKKEYPIVGIDKKVKSVLVGGFGQDIGGTEFFYLLEDGTIKRTALFGGVIISKNTGNEDEITSTVADEIIATGPISGVNDITQLYNASVYSRNGLSGWVTTIAMKADGTFYNLDSNSLKRIK